MHCKKIKFFSIVFWFFFSIAAAEPELNNGIEKHGAEINGALPNGLLPEAYGGVVVNQTITVVGHDFYQYFMAGWRDKDMNERFALSIQERPSARWGNLVWVEFAQKRVFQTYLPPSRSAVKAVSEQAVEIAYQNVIDADVQRLLFRDEDLGPDEI
jgi:curli production assembly/transport component CsgE